MQKQLIRLWLGIGAYSILTNPAVSVDLEFNQQHAASTPLQLADSGHGGEGGESVWRAQPSGEGGEGGEGKILDATQNTDVFYSQLMMMLGHMYAGHALFDARKPEIGSIHLGHPAGEHLPNVRQALANRGLDHVSLQVEQLANAAGKSNSWPELREMFETTQQAIHEAAADVQSELRNDPEFILQVVITLLNQSRHEYKESIEDNHFVLAHEYQDSFGFMNIGRELLVNNAAIFQQIDKDAYKNMLASYEDAMQAWPGPVPPAEPIMTVSELYGKVASFEFAASKF